jgi:hypothetical protein
VGDRGACARKSTGQVLCWGHIPDSGQGTEYVAPEEVSGTFSCDGETKPPFCDRVMGRTLVTAVRIDRAGASPLNKIGSGARQIRLQRRVQRDWPSPDERSWHRPGEARRPVRSRSAVAAGVAILRLGSAEAINPQRQNQCFEALILWLGDARDNAPWRRAARSRARRGRLGSVPPLARQGAAVNSAASS